jgi:uncharacterized radical SAM superfamily protein
MTKRAGPSEGPSNRASPTGAETPYSVSDSAEEELRRARDLSWTNHGKRIVFYLPGMFCCEGARGTYPAISITGGECELKCDHCRGRILRDMITADSPERLVETCRKLARAGMDGCLISGGSTRDGTLPWDTFINAIATVKREIDLIISIHTGFVDLSIARRLKEAGVDQALVDVVGSADTLAQICHLPPSLARMEETLDALFTSGLDVVPHVVAGLHRGVMNGEARALEMIARYRPSALVLIALMPLRETPMEGIGLPPDEEIAGLFSTARFLLPHTSISLGCARPRTSKARVIEHIALASGVNRMALPSPATVASAESYGLEIVQRTTCCSLPRKER